MSKRHLDVGALFCALEDTRESRQVSWQELGDQLGINPAVFTRMNNGWPPDVDDLLTLTHWMGVDASLFANDLSPDVVVRRPSLAELKAIGVKSDPAIEEILARYAVAVPTQ